MNNPRNKIDDFTDFETGLNGWSSIQGTHRIKTEGENNYLGFIGTGTRPPHFHIEKNFVLLAAMKLKVSFDMRITNGVSIKKFYMGKTQSFL
ncbi:MULTISPECIES: hypothetical protein [Pseudomonas]|uniref:hypothetical protein n=1 Tax=Pseudomonas sp. BF-R-19 TaxID=2832397 RepID=UPI001CBE01C6|nr:hypothetical protein [Pseudomonas sp. BF-R-19]